MHQKLEKLKDIYYFISIDTPKAGKAGQIKGLNFIGAPKAGKNLNTYFCYKGLSVSRSTPFKTLII